MNKERLYTDFVYHQAGFGKNGVGLKYQKALERIQAGQTILEVGCHTGYLGRELTNMGCKVWGVEINKEAATKAKPFYERMIVGDIEDEETWRRLPGDFDAILFLDVLEHMVDPWKVLSESKGLLKPEGSLLITLPNVAFYAIRRGLLFGRFDYHDSGLLDKTHLRFFTFHSAQRFIQKCGYHIQDWQVTVSELPLEYRLPFLKVFYNKLRPFLSKRFPNLFGGVIFYQAIQEYED